MPHKLEYHVPMRPVISPSVATLAVLAISLLIPVSQAQVNGAPASVTSPGFGGRAINGAPASVTSLGPRGFAPGPQLPPASVGNGFHHNNGHRHYHNDSQFLGPVWYGVPYAIPYAGDNAAVDEDSEDNDPNYQGGPTVFDRRGSGESSYVPPVKNSPPAHAAAADDPPADPDPPQPPTLLIFKDGHRVEIGNYAILGATLFDLTPGHPRRVAIADLDLEATCKQNDERGVTFRLPPSIQSN